MLSQRYTWSFVDTAIMYARQELRLSQQLNFESGIATSLNDLAGGLTTLGNYTAALDLGYKSLSMYKKLKDTLGITFALGTLGLCYRDQGDYVPAIQNIREAIRLIKLKYGGDNLTVISGMLSSVYERSNRLDSALLYAQQAYRQRSDWTGLLTVLGAIHSKLGNYGSSLAFYRKAIPLAIQGNAQIDILDALNGMARVYLNIGKTDSAIYYAKQALTQKWGKGYPISTLHASTLLANIYESQNKTDSTLKYLKLTINLKDSLFNQQKTREAQGFTFNEQLHQQELKQQLAQSELQYKNRLNVYILLGGLFILLLVAAGLWRRNVYKQKSYTLLEKQKQEIDLQKAKAEESLHKLQSTQAQLIQSEKMASLGELTAGIAHEIQNPLNFVNNFSEVNNELIEEMNNENDIAEIKAIANDIKQNNEKIAFHGKRADSIVKGMMQHSQVSTGQKEPTDINALADEYLRLSYHGIRAKGKSLSAGQAGFNATLETDFDTSIGKINIVPQEIGRVLLNLYNNAFYAVNEKAKQQPNGYEPVISVTTKKLNDKVEIRVKDNGNGIPQNILEKIFQPFFTTKPTGQGTGLGLSLSYDIIKAHGGEIKVETKEGEGTIFIIQLNC
ncbi:MAG TPA: tetratricopeptide repeat protein [Chitinophagaceae bacterium]|nr:tetratricopeptide repeat protein [Chitinophagaceae bacterium]